MQFAKPSLIALMLAASVGCNGGGSDNDGSARPHRYDDELPVAKGPAIYADALDSAYRDQSSGVRDLAQRAEVHSGKYAIAFRPDRRLSLTLSAPSGHDLAGYDTLEMWVNGGVTGGQSVRLALFVGGDEVSDGVNLSDYTESGSLPAGRWQRLRIPLAELGASGTKIYGLFFQSMSAGNESTLYIDDIALVRTGVDVPAERALFNDATPSDGAVLVNPEADRHPISPLVYGINTGDTAGQAKMRYPVRRWGGNHTSRYAWDNDTTNRGSDSFSKTSPRKTITPSSCRMALGPIASSTTPTLMAAQQVTVPMLGWVAKDRQTRWGFSVSKYGGQQQTDCQSGRCDAGNGVSRGGGFIKGNDPNDTSKAIGPDYVVDWKKRIEERTGGAAEGGVRFFALDNELTL